MTDTKITNIGEPDIEGFRASLRGDLVEPHHAEYEEARTTYNATVDKRPAMIARCADVADVISAVNFARENELLLSILCGGHSSGQGLVDDGLVIDLSFIKGVRVDPSSRTVRVGGGAIWGEVDHATYAFGLAVPSGVISTTGVGGLTLGGGHGYLTRKYGLTIDNLLEADVVLADGSFVTASEENNEDLFWAIRGGGGNFGVVTSFLFKAHPVETVYAGPMFWELDRAREVLRWYDGFIREAPEDLYGFFAFMVAPSAPPFPEHLQGKNVCSVIWSYTGPMEEAEEVFNPIRQVAGSPALDLTGPVPYPAMQSMSDAMAPAGLQHYWRGNFINELSEEAIEAHLKYGSKLPTAFSTVHLYPVNGAAHRVGRNETAFSHRDATYSQAIIGVDPDPVNKDRITAWTKDYHDALHPHSGGGAYVNFIMDDEGQDRVKASYRDNYERLVKVKDKYDPNNLFQVNQNIRPIAQRKE